MFLKQHTVTWLIVVQRGQVLKDIHVPVTKIIIF